jgi:4-hydroxy-tetrahydrodipicolinate reductase
MTKIAIFGAAGRMGQALIRCAARRADVRLCAAVEQSGNPALGRDAGTVAGIDATGVLVSDDAAAAAAAADVVIDFTFHTVTPKHAALVASSGRGMVIGTTGLDAAETRAVHEAARKIPIVWAPNMSLGVNLLFALVEQTSRTLGMDYDIEIIETHHRRKKDAPSGTALRLGEKAAQGRGQSLESAVTHGRCGITGDRPRGQIGMHAMRAGDAIGDHTVLFATDGERLELSHRATNRDAFAAGALRAAVWVAGRTPGLYDMKDVLGL